MCGINGIVYLDNRKVEKHEINAMNNEIIHRGPDGEGVYLSNNVGLGHRRLSIIDVAHHSDQPFYSEDKDYILIFNGEIYNYLEIRSDLISKGHVFKTNSDTEVLLRAYIEFGQDCLQYLNGMFSFAVYNKNNNSLFIARDRIGIKPLFYFYSNRSFIFSSEIKSIRKVLNNQLSINDSMIDVYLSSGYCYGNDTLFNEIKKLEPGHSVLISNNDIKINKYWDVSYSSEFSYSERKYLSDLDELIVDATKIHLRSDVPLGVFLSGGLDSSAIVALMHALDIRNINTFSVGWDLGDNFNEFKYSRQVSNDFNTKHYEYVMNERIFMEAFDEYLHYMDEPVTEAAAISLYKLSELTRDHVKVVLSGEGADEVFGGYPIYKFFKYLEVYKKIPRSIRNSLINPIFSKLDRRIEKFARLSNENIEDFYSGVSFGNHDDISVLYTKDYRYEGYYKNIIKEIINKVSQFDLQKKLQYIDYKTWLVDDLLIKADRMTMANSLELRVPLLDYRLIDYVSKIPSSYRLKNGNTKYLFKKIMEKYLPSNIIYRKKMGFPTPLKKMFGSKLGGKAKDILLDDVAISRNYFNKKSLIKMFSDHEKGYKDNHKLIWKLYVLESWLAKNS